MNIMQLLSGALGGSQGAQIGRQLGLNETQTQAAISAAVPLLLNGLANNAQNPQGAQSLAGALEQHDGHALDRLQNGVLPDTQEGGKITQHVFGAQEPQAATAVGRAAGISPQLASQVLSLIAPLILAALSQRLRHQGNGGQGNAGTSGGLGGVLGGVLGSVLGGNSQNQGGQVTSAPSQGGRIDPSALGQVLGQEKSQMQTQLPGILGQLSKMVDRDGDGNPFNDLTRMLGRK